MNYHFIAHRQVRQNLCDVLDSLSLDELTTIPDGFNNNIYWNIAHCMATQQLLAYYLSDNSFRIDVYWINQYKKGTLPKLDVDASEIETLRFLLKETSKVLEKDYYDGLFEDYKPYVTSFGLELKSIQDAIVFNNMHESLHYGYVLAQKRALAGQKKLW
ncbi:DinB family protein [Riemerella columbipharyngis]|uniref:DinB superfamily protein n=1 Tax=Riemerella columbipharyngis TaxID=1071918 RepID=A0A1G6Y2S8_9FLAO|nr:DinB family protein [Riemerella columbipharyngis]SDD84698.1 DinB superfamily protein [Riemerella columbipharyngis]